MHSCRKKCLAWNVADVLLAAAKDGVFFILRIVV